MPPRRIPFNDLMLEIIRHMQGSGYSEARIIGDLFEDMRGDLDGPLALAILDEIVDWAKWARKSLESGKLVGVGRRDPRDWSPRGER